MVNADIVIDTNVLVAALRSKLGVSHKLMMLVGTGLFEIHLSVPLVLEYEYAAKAHVPDILLSKQDVDDILDYLCAVSQHHEISFLWRPHVKDPMDDMVLELAFTASCNNIVTFNSKDFIGVEELGIEVVNPREFLEIIGEEI